MPVSQFQANSDLDADYGANVPTTVASGSDGVNTSTFAGSGVLNVATTATFRTTGTLTVATAGTPAIITFTGVTGTTFTGCTTVSGGGALAIGGSVAGTIFVALATALPSASADTFAEPTTAQWGGYARVAVLNNSTNWPPASAGVKSNGTTITFPSSSGGTSSPVTLTYLVTVDMPTGGHMIDYLALPGGTSVASGQSLAFPAGAVSISEA